MKRLALHLTCIAVSAACLAANPEKFNWANSLTNTKEKVCDENLDTDFRDYRWQAGLAGGLKSGQAWEMEPFGIWHFHRTLGVKLGINITSQYNQPTRAFEHDGKNWNLDRDYQDIDWLLFKPALAIRTPYLFHRDDYALRLWLQAEPGITLGVPFRNSLLYLPEGNGLETSAQPMKVSNTHIRWFYWDIRASINFGYNRWIWTLGYGFSDFDIYACRRHITLPSGTRFYVPSREFSHTVYISLSYQL